MFDYTLQARLIAGETVYTVWSSVPENGLVELFAQGPFGAVTLDMQHGGHHEHSVLSGLSTVIHSGKAAVVRVPLGRMDMASRALDMGADAIIAPMINSVQDAVAFRDAVKFPPLGGRSWGASRAVAVRGIAGGNEYLATSNVRTVSFAMIETREAFDRVSEIAAIDGIDGLFVGPADFSIAWTGGKSVDPGLPEMDEAVASIAAAARDAGKHAGIFVANPAMARKYHQMGFRFMALGFDVAIVAEGQKAILAMAEEASGDNGSSAGY
ncbi:HpcH/HpaI aldolase family protein [Oricola cellulosilytica]|uniref:2,4-dihydroxyhept-2-ene-1,7-dioic acid aldolase n=1 Tax=Oricola cellulosilytica TaxID=1429082 RepID=A0A4R0PEC6_9HYPH|nr:aldolase/citrate lyase family protein [Oricola cellulosilytica]TCD14545.1 2,4-dihydroxyhept-2-ene-1,7-dioic acid aldolase [Oricola cellulosilytica]